MQRVRDMRITNREEIDALAKKTSELRDGLTLFASQMQYALDACVHYIDDDTNLYVINEYERTSDKASENECCERYNISSMTSFNNLFECYRETSVVAYTARDEYLAHCARFISENNCF